MDDWSASGLAFVKHRHLLITAHPAFFCPCTLLSHTRFVLAAIKAAGGNVSALEKKLNEPFDPYAE
jgi:hypothetical protein